MDFTEDPPLFASTVKTQTSQLTVHAVTAHLRLHRRSCPGGADTLCSQSRPRRTRTWREPSRSPRTPCPLAARTPSSNSSGGCSPGLKRQTQSHVTFHLLHQGPMQCYLWTFELDFLILLYVPDGESITVSICREAPGNATRGTSIKQVPCW